MEPFIQEETAPQPAQQPQVAQGQGGALLSAPVQPGPLDAPEQPASEEEQAQYLDLLSRVTAFVHDTKENEDGEAPADKVMDMLANPDLAQEVAIGHTTALILQMFHNNAKRQGVEYSGDVLREVGMDLVGELYETAMAVGIYEDMSEAEAYTPEQEEMLEMAVLEATKKFGEYLQSTGQIDAEKQQGAQGEFMEQVEREAQAGELDDYEGPAATPEMVNSLMQAQGGQ